MRIILITPAPPQSRAGNRATAVRWAEILQNLGHRVDVSVAYDGAPYNMMIALHAWRSAAAVARFDELYPDRPLIVALTGTDLYRFIDSHPEPTLRSIALADRLVALHELAHEAIPQAARAKLHVIYQSAKPLAQKHAPSRRYFDVCVAGHLRDEKDPLRAAYAAREVPPASRLRVRHYGKAHDESWAQLARAEMACNARYRWFDEVAHGKVRAAYARCRAMVLSSKMEGGANVISEAVVARLPIIASNIPGSVGLLGADYPGYYPVGDTAALRELLGRAETDDAFLPELERCGAERAHLFTPQNEAAGWRSLLNSLP